MYDLASRLDQLAANARNLRALPGITPLDPGCLTDVARTTPGRCTHLTAMPVIGCISFQPCCWSSTNAPVTMTCVPTAGIWICWRNAPHAGIASVWVGVLKQIGSMTRLPPCWLTFAPFSMDEYGGSRRS